MSTKKGQVVIDSDLRIICTLVAMTNTHDFKLYKQSRFPLPQMLKVCVNTGYLGITNFHENSEMPKKKTKLNPLLIEHINAKIKAFRHGLLK